MMQVKGKIQQVLKPESGVSKAGNEWKKQEFVIETIDQFSRKICFTLFNDKLSLIDGISNGDEVEVSFNIESREFNGKWFHNINAWKIDKPEKSSYNEPSPPLSLDDIPPEPAEDGFNDLPF